MSIIEKQSVSSRSNSVYENILQEFVARNIEVDEAKLRDTIDRTVELLFTATDINEEYEEKKDKQVNDIDRIKHYIYQDKEPEQDSSCIPIEFEIQNLLDYHYNFNEYVALNLLKGLNDSKNPLPFELSPLNEKDCIVVNEMINQFSDRRATNPNTFQFLHQRQIAAFLVDQGIYGDVNKLEAYVKDKIGIDTNAQMETGKVMQTVFGDITTFLYFVEDHHAHAKNPLYQLDRELLARHGDFTKEELDYFTYCASNEEIVEELNKLGVQFVPNVKDLNYVVDSIYKNYIFYNKVDSYYESYHEYAEDDYETVALDDIIHNIDDINSDFIMTHAMKAETFYTLRQEFGVQLDDELFSQLTNYIKETQGDHDDLDKKRETLLNELKEADIHLDLDQLAERMGSIAKDIDIEAMSRIGPTTFCPNNGETYVLDEEDFINEYIRESFSEFDFYCELDETQQEYADDNIIEECDEDYYWSFDDFIDSVFSSYMDGGIIFDYSNDEISISDRSNFFVDKMEKSIVQTIAQTLEYYGYEHGFEGFMKERYAKANEALEKEKAPRFYFAKVEENREKRSWSWIMNNEKENIEKSKWEVVADEDILLDEDTLDVLEDALTEFMDEEEDLDL